MGTQRRALLGDAGHGRPDRPGHADPRPLGWRAARTIATPDPQSRAELMGERILFGLAAARCARGRASSRPRRAPRAGRPGEPGRRPWLRRRGLVRPRPIPPSRRLARRPTDGRRPPQAGLPAPARGLSAAGRLEQPGQVAHATRIADPELVAFELDRPVLALAVERRRLGQERVWAERPAMPPGPRSRGRVPSPAHARSRGPDGRARRPRRHPRLARACGAPPRDRAGSERPTDGLPSAR